MPKFKPAAQLCIHAQKSERLTFLINFVLADTHQSHPHNMKSIGKLEENNFHSGWHLMHEFHKHEV